MILDPLIQKMVDELADEGVPPVYTLTPDQARDGLLRMQSGSFLKPSSQISDLKVDFAGQALRLRIIRPIDRADNLLPVILYFHGGGWVLGDATTHDRLVRELAVGAEAAVVFVDYDRAPEHRYPVAIEQAYAAICYVAGNSDALHVDATRMAIAGDSAGGNIATVACLMAKQRSHLRISAQLLFYPVTSAGFDSESFKQFEKGPWLTKAATQWFWDQYLPDVTRRTEPWASPLLAPKEQLAGLPRTLIITSENDVLRDQGEEYGRKLMMSGAKVVTTRYIGTIHDFAMLNQLADAAPTRAAIAQAIDFLRSALSEAPTWKGILRD
jgi:acetyl esterase